MPMTLVSACFLSVSTVSTLYGIFLVLFCMSMFMLVRDLPATPSERRATYTSMPFIGNVLLFLTLTPHWALVAWRSFQAFVPSPDGPGPLLFYAEMMNASSVALTALSAIAVTIGDCLLIYRLWVIWDRKWYIAALPVLSVFGGIASFIGVTYMESRYAVGNIAAEAHVDRWMMTCYGSTMGTNLYSCGLISWRLWRRFSVPTINPQLSRNLVMRTLAIFTESAALYVSWVIICLIAATTGSATAYFTGEAVVPITGIAFMLIHVRIKLGYAAGCEPASAGVKRQSRLKSARPVAVNITSVGTTYAYNMPDEREAQ